MILYALFIFSKVSIEYVQGKQSFYVIRDNFMKLNRFPLGSLFITSSFESGFLKNQELYMM